MSTGGSQARSVDADHTHEFHVDPVSKRLIRDRKSADRKSLDRKAGKPEKAPEFVTKPRRQFTDEGQTAKFKASFEGPPTTKLLWTFNGMVLSNDAKHKIYQEKDVHWLEVCDVTKDDTGLYTCTIQNATGSSQASAELEVLVKPKPVSKKGFVAPEVDIPLNDQYITPDQKSVILECKFSNAIDANTTWYKDGRKLNSGYFAKQTFDGRLARLTLNKVSDREMGKYECVASNSGGEAKTWAQLSYKVAGLRSIPPKFAVPLTNQTLSPGDQLILESTVTGYPKPSIKWYKNNREIHSSKTAKMEFDGSKVRLTMSNVQTSDSDSYKCVAENEAGQDKIKADVSVIVPSSAAPDDFKEPPVFVKELVDMEANDGDRVELAVQVEGTPPIEIVWVHKDREISFDDPVFKMKSEGPVHRLIIPEVLPEDTGEFVCEAYNDYGDTDTFCFLTVKESDRRRSARKF